MSEENTENKSCTEALNRENGREESRAESREETPKEGLEPGSEEDRKSLIAFLKSIRFRRGGTGAKTAECDGHFAGLQSKVKRRRTQDETLAVRSAN